jgi:hypothetical protein
MAAEAQPKIAPAGHPSGTSRGGGSYIFYVKPITPAAQLHWESLNRRKSSYDAESSLEMPVFTRGGICGLGVQLVCVNTHFDAARPFKVVMEYDRGGRAIIARAIPPNDEGVHWALVGRDTLAWVLKLFES